MSCADSARVTAVSHAFPLDVQSAGGAVPLVHDRPEPSVDAPAGEASAARRRLADVGVVLTVVAWATWLTWGWGGREPHRLSVFAVLVLVAVVLVRPWRVIPAWILLLASALGVSAFCVAAVAPTGWAGAGEAASYAVSGQLFLVVAAWARDSARRKIAFGIVITAGLLQFSQGWLAWWGSGAATTPFLGTFYWHNQVGIVAAATAVAALAVVMFGTGPLRTLAWAAAPLTGAVTIFTTSRGSQLALVLGVLLLAAAALVAATPVRRLGRLCVAVLAMAACAAVLSGPPFFAAASTPGSGNAARGESFTGNGIHRLEFWRRAWEIFLDWPITGAGFKSFGAASRLATDTRGEAIAASAHNGFLQALADGGLVLATPLWLGTIIALVAMARRWRRASATGDAVTIGATAATVVLILHAGMDFDWTFPALLCMPAILLALCGLLSAEPIQPPRKLVVVSYVAVAMTLLGVAAVAGWDGGVHRSLPLGPQT